ncbi:hypothetical protein OHA37_26875 [Streptomyces sp. NBC_00335]|uniref:hypothetical protein n=1 Tax=unclassified Streptomyces TaxID=2593676 RepID=UPI0022538E0C|nr:MULTISPECIES: hypothetical protein [unclassified Streptomyces]MCX5407474.1 hypothetical protein [Streptomyces sp. NBC_00086]
MGIDFSHGGAQWAYSGFALFRKTIANHEGIDLGKMQGFGGNRHWDSVATPLRPLLDHSDCDGELTPAECREVAPALRRIVEAIWESGDYDHGSGLALADGMEQAAANDEPLEFQ